MHICGFHIDGFGIFHDQGINDIPGGLVLFTGQNESGKSTLMEFVRAILFGFVSTRSKKQNHYPPLRGGNHGGRLKVMMRDGRLFTMERLGKSLAVADDVGSDQSVELHRLLGGIDRDTFQRIFAIGWKDLQGLDWLSQDSVRGRLLAASIGAGAESVPAAIEWLAKEMGGLLRARQARHPLINDHVRQLAEISEEIRNGQALPTDYAELQRERARLEEQIGRGRNTLEWLNQVEHLRDDLEGALEAKRTCEAKIERVEKQLAEVTVDEVIIEHQEAIRALMGEKGKLVSELTDYPEIVDGMRQAEEGIREQIAGLELDWHLDRIVEVDTSDQTRQNVSDFESQLDAAERDHELKKDRQQSAEEAERKAKLSLEEAQKRLDSLPVPPITDVQELSHKQDMVRKIRSLLHQRDNVNIELRGKRERQHEVKARLEPLQKQMGEQIDQLSLWAPITVFAAGGVGAILGLVLVILRIYTPGIVLGALSLAGAGLGAWLRNRRRNQTDDETRRVAQLQADIQEIEQRERKLSAEMGELETKLADIAEEVKTLSQQFDIEKLDDMNELEELEGKLKREAEKLSKWTAQTEKRDEAERNWQDAREQLSQMAQEADDVYGELQRIELEWQKWLAQQGFTEAVRPAGFRGILEQVAALQRTEKARQELEDRADRIEAYLDGVRSRIHNELSACGIEPSGDEVGAADLDALDHALSAALEAQLRQQNLEQQLVEAREDLKRLDEGANERRVELERLLQQASTTDEEESCSIADTLESQLDKDVLKRQLKELEEQVSEDISESGRLEEKLTQMAQSERLGRLLFEQRRLQAELDILTRRWATLVVCNHLLGQTRDIYERERQPKVIQEANRYVNTMTNGSYRLYMPAGEFGNVQLEDDSSSRKGEIGWSSGLADQVYLSMRLAWAEDFAEHAEPLPLILDDVLVTFDPDRQLGAAKVVLDLAQHHQILMFTCHPRIREITEQALQDCDFRDDVAVTYYAINEGAVTKV